MKQAELIARFGDPGVRRDTPDPAWVKANIVYCGGSGKAELPAMPGVPERFWFAVHRDVEPMMRAGFAAALEACPEYKIERAGCFVFRRQRWDTIEKAEHEGRKVRDLSDHSWATAVDIDAAKNRAVQFHGRQPKPWSPEWLEVWPAGLPETFVRAFCQASGFEWGGDWKGYVDPQHFQAR